MGLFGRKKEPDPKAPAPAGGDAAPGDPLAGIPEDELAAPTFFKKPAAPAQQASQFTPVQAPPKPVATPPSARPAMPSSTMVPKNVPLSPSQRLHAQANASSDQNKVLPKGEEAASLKSSRSGTFVKPGSLASDDFVEQLASSLGMGKIDLAKFKPTPELLALVPKKVAKDYKCFPVEAEGDYLIRIAIADPSNIQVTDDLERILRRRVEGVVAREEDIERAYKRFYEGNELSEMYQGVTDALRDKEAVGEDFVELEATDDANTPPVVKFVDLIFRLAVRDRASDIHIEPTRNAVTIRFRIDGVCHEVPAPPKKWQNAIISRLKVMSGMDLAEKRIPQDGRIKLNLGEKKLDLRVSALPAIYGESIVMRILDQSSVMLGLSDVGFMPDNIALFGKLIQSPTGVILMTGPTGSGKTTTLYAALSQLNNAETKIITIENPVEYMMDGVNQVQVNEEVGLDFKNGLRSMLRQSPDVILVGEIRDYETAEIAIRAALTGHLVFSTLHTNDAPSSTTRLIDMGVKPFLVASSIQAVIAQRLIRKLCQHCKRKQHTDISKYNGLGATEEEMRAGVEIHYPGGCERCSNSGYRGRTAIHEIFVMDAQLRQLVMRGEPSNRLKRIALRNGMRTLRMDGWKKVMLGNTSLEELDRITGAD